MAACNLRYEQLEVVVVVAFLCVVLVAANEEYEAGTLGVKFGTRQLLQTVQPCPIDFQTQNYTVVTNVCNGTNPNRALCCNAFVVLACPFAPYLNDPSTNCATTMFSYLNMAGKYPPGLFQICQGDENGLPCPLVPEPSPNPSSSTMDIPSRRISFLVVLLISLLGLAQAQRSR